MSIWLFSLPEDYGIIGQNFRRRRSDRQFVAWLSYAGNVFPYGGRTKKSPEENALTANTKLYRMILSAMFLAVALVLPFLTGQIPQIGNALCPMHLPVFLCAFFCGPWYAAAVGAAAPLLRFLIFGMPPIMPSGVAMCVELAVYGASAGIFYRLLPEKNWAVYVALIGAMLAGRVMWGAARTILYGLGSSQFGWAAFISGAVLNSVPGIILQIVLIPVLVLTLRKYTCRR